VPSLVRRERVVDLNSSREEVKCKPLKAVLRDIILIRVIIMLARCSHRKVVARARILGHRNRWGQSLPARISRRLV